MSRYLTILFVLLAAPTSAAGTDQSPYSGLEARDIKALSEEQVASYHAGDGMGFALAAELNGYPGPKHVLELADELDLTADQRDRVEEVFAAMHEAAVTLGVEIVAAEAALDRAFADGTIDGESLGTATVAIGTLAGRLRGAHLAAHLRTLDLLEPEQVQRYVHLRGYGTGGHAGMKHGDHH